MSIFTAGPVTILSSGLMKVVSAYWWTATFIKAGYKTVPPFKIGLWLTSMKTLSSVALKFGPLSRLNRKPRTSTFLNLHTNVHQYNGKADPGHEKSCELKKHYHVR